jgi:cytochrome c oxidase subunit 2
VKEGLPLFPDAASTWARGVDHLYFYLLGVSGFFALLICVLIVVFAIRYRRSKGHQAVQIPGSLPLELFWMGVPLVLALSMFAWGAKLFVEVSNPPAGATEIHVVGKQWMWKIQHRGGQREIDELHVPLGEPVRLVMISQDVIHSFFVPAFRMKRDVLPGRYSTTWFQATRPGTYHLFCAEYCGTKHSHMVGRVHVLEPAEYERWLASTPVLEGPVDAGHRLFEALRCDTCHSPTSGPRGPDLAGLYGRQVALAGGGSVLADEGYLRQSILDPHALLTEGFEPLMPSYAGQVDEDQVLQLIAYLKSLGAAPAGGERR